MMGFNKKIYLIVSIPILGILFYIGSSILIQQKPIEISNSSVQVIENPQISSEPVKNKTATVILVGDIMLDRGVEYMIEKYGQGDFKFPFLKIADDLKGADILFGNLEGPISDKGTKVGSIYSFRNNPKTIEGLTFSGFDILSLANNHAFDYGREALEDTFLRLKTANIDYVGAGFNEKEAYSPIIKEIQGIKITFLAYTNLGPETWEAGENNSGIAWISENPSTTPHLLVKGAGGAGPVPYRPDEIGTGTGGFETAKESIKKAKESADVLIVSLHAGEEYQKTPTQFQIDFSKMAIDAGADIVVGHHPHIIQSNEKYKDGYIFYSLGNFVFDQGFSEETMEGQIIKVLVEDKKIKSAIPINIQINEYFQPEIKKEALPEISLSSEKLEQGDTLLIKVGNGTSIDKITGEFNLEKIDFFKPANLKTWIGILGIDAKEKPGQYDLIINFPNGSKIKKKINIAERKFPVTELLVTKELEEKGYTPAKIVENITTKENLTLKEILSIYTEKAYFNQAFTYPLEKIEVVGAYGNIRKSGDVGAQHLGVDLEADIGTPVYAVNDGTVRFSQELTTYGKTLIIDHGLGIFSLYLHLDEFKVSEGDSVKRGEIIGLSGNTGYSIAPHLHFSIKANGASVDPLKFIETIEKELTK